MKKRNLTTCLLLFAFCISCNMSDKIPPEGKSIDLSSVMGHSSKEKIFKDVRFIQLETVRENLLGDDLYFEISSDKIYIFDRGNQKSVFIFDEDGKYVGKSGRPGKGPGEYVNAVDFLVRNDTVDFLVQQSPNASVYSYTSSGDFIRETKLNLFPYSFQLIQNKFYAVSMNYNKMIHDHQIYLLDKTGNDIKKYLPNETEINIPIGENCFGKSEDEVFYFEPFNDTVYKFDDTLLNPFYAFDFGDYTVPDKFFQTDIMKGFQMINEKGFALIKNIFANKENMIFEIVRQKSGMATSVFFILYNRKTEKIKYFTSTEEDVIFRYPVGLNDKNEMMFLVFPFDSVDKNAEEFGIDLHVKEFNEADNPVLMFCEI
jgi:hypothetical protein